MRATFESAAAGERTVAAVAASALFLAQIASARLGWPLTECEARIVWALCASIVVVTGRRRGVGAALALIALLCPWGPLSGGAFILGLAAISGHSINTLTGSLLLWLAALSLNSLGITYPAIWGGTLRLEPIFLPHGVLCAAAIVRLSLRARRHDFVRHFGALGVVVAGAIVASASTASVALEATFGLHAGHNHAPLPYSERGWSSAALALAEGLSAGICARAERRRQDRLGSWRLAALFVSAVLATTAAVGNRVDWQGATKGGNVLVHADGGGGFEKPSWGADQSEAEMFGALTSYAKTMHAELCVLETKKFFTELQAATQGTTAMLFNPTRIWRPDELDALWRFVDSGGRLIVVGDHTNVFGVMDSANPLLSRFGIAFVFDSAYPLKESWASSAVWLRSLHGLQGDLLRTCWGIGSSLRTWGPARTILAGRFALGDLGDPENQVGAFLGNYRPDPGEPIGERCLLACAEYGEGMVLAYGDSSSWQNVALASSWDAHVSTVLGPPSARGGRFAVLAVLATLAGAAIAFVLAHRSGLALGLVAASAVSYSAFIALDNRATVSEPACTGAVIVSEGSDIGHYSSGWNDIGGLIDAVQRSGHAPVMVAPTDERVGSSKLSVLVAPRYEIDSSLAVALDCVLEHGGTVLILAAGEGASSVNPWLMRHGVRIDLTISGPLPGPGFVDQKEPKFVSPGRIKVDPTAEELWTDVAVLGSDRLAGVMRAGAGRIAVLADERFCASHNYEGTWGRWQPNQAMMRQLLEQPSNE